MISMTSVTPDLRNVDLNLLVAFDMLMTERSVTKAARRLSIGQSAMSSTLSRLRKMFDDQLLIREGRHLVTTPLAESLEAPVREILTQIEGVLSRPSSFDPVSSEMTFSVIANDYLMMTFLQPLLTRFPAHNPGIRLHIRPPGDDAADRLRRHEADLMLIPREVLTQNSEFHVSPLFEDRYLVALDKDHPEVGAELSLEQFSSLPYVAMSPGYQPAISEQQLDFLVVPRSVEVMTGFAIVPFLLRGTRMIALVQERLGRAYQEAAQIRLLEPPIPRLQPIHVVMAWTARTNDDPGHRWFRNTLTELAGVTSTRTSRQNR